MEWLVPANGKLLEVSAEELVFHFWFAWWEEALAQAEPAQPPF